MPGPRKRRRCMVEEDLQGQNETQGPVSVPVLISEEDSSSSYTCSSSFPSSFSSTSSYSPLKSNTPEDDIVVSEASGPTQSPQGACSSIAMASVSDSQSSEDSESEESPSISQVLSGVASLPKSEMNVKVDELVKFLLFKYLMKEPVTKAEILSDVIGNYQDYFQVIFNEAFECMQLVFGIDMKAVEPTAETYILVRSLELTYDGILHGALGIPKTGLLIMVICIIFMEDNCASEQMLWEVLNNVGLYAGDDHFIFGEPRKLINENFVQEGYLEYRWVPGSYPPCYEFFCGARTYAETTKMKVLEFLTTINGTDPRSYPVWYAEALGEEEERAKPK